MAKRRAKRAAAKAPSLAVRKACFLEVLRQTGNVSRAAREAGLSSSTVYAHRAKHPGFARDWDAVMNEALDELEAQAMDRARTGVEKPVYYRGEIVGSVRTYSDQLTMFLLKAHRPEVYDRLGRAPAAMRTITQSEAKTEVLRRLDLLSDGSDEDYGEAQA